MAEGVAQPTAQPGNWKDPYRAYNFKLSFEDNITEGAFTEVLGLGAQIERIEFRPAGNNNAVLSVPGRVTYPPVQLRFGLTDSQVLWDWLVTAIDGDVRRRNTTITVQQPNGAQDAVRWHLSRAWPMEWAGAPLDTFPRICGMLPPRATGGGGQREPSSERRAGTHHGRPGDDRHR